MATPSFLIISLLLVMLGTFFVCGIPFGLLVGHALGTDPRTVGSKNIGATNVSREINFFAGVLTALLDMAKGFVCTYFGVRIIALVLSVAPVYFLPDGPSLPQYAWVSAFIFLAAICGHVFSPYLKFKGGKGIAVGFGAALGFSWPIALGLIVVWGLCCFPTRYVSVASIASAAALPFLAFFIYYPVTISFEIPLVLISIIVIWAHRKNLSRLRRGLEPRLSGTQKSQSLEALLDPELDEEIRLEEAVLAEGKVSNAGEDLPEQGTSVFFGSEPVVTSHVQKRVERLNTYGRDTADNNKTNNNEED